MTQLIIAGVEAVLPQQFSVTVKRENPFFTKSGEYTYDVQLRLDNPVNLGLYGFLNRLNGTSQVPTGRQATLMADGHVYCRGTEVVTKWTDQTVSIQIVSGESELNWLVGQDRKIEDLDLGTTGRVVDIWYDGLEPVYAIADYCLVPVRTKNGVYLNSWTSGYEGDNTEGNNYYHTFVACMNATPQPYICPLVERLLGALGYTIVENQLQSTMFGKAFLVNTSATREYAKMFAGWTVKDLLTEIENLTGCIIVTDNSDHGSLKCSILQKTAFYIDARQLVLNDVIDTYEAEAVDGDGQQQEFTSCDVAYDFPDHRWAKLMDIPEEAKDAFTVEEYESMADLKAAAADHQFTDTVIMKDTSTGRCYIRAVRREEWVSGTHETTWLQEVDAFGNLDRQNSNTKLSLKITPAPMAWLGTGSWAEIIDLGSEDGFHQPGQGGEGGSDDDDTATDFEDQIRNYSVQESETVDLYCAFYNGTIVPINSTRGPMAYTDAYHAEMQGQLYDINFSYTGNAPQGSLRLQDLDADYYQGGYQIDTRRAVTFETFDPNRIDVRQVYVVRGRRYVVRDCEETIGPDGRQPLWRVTCYPIDISDEAIEKRWVLTKGVWDDGAAWLDDGRWNDE